MAHDLQGELKPLITAVVIQEERVLVYQNTLLCQNPHDTLAKLRCI